MSQLFTFPNLKNARNDVPAGLVVFLVALPLCLGIALASGAPLMSGLISGIVGGLIVTLFSGSELSVSGPAAGLAVIVLQSIASLGAYDVFLVAVVLAGLFQLLFSFMRAGQVVDYVPTSVIRGMLSGIGVMIILKQIPHAIGWDVRAEGDEAFVSLHHDGPFADILTAISGITPGAAIIGVTCLLLLIAWQLPRIKKSRLGQMIPGPLIAVVAGTLINEFFTITASPLALKSILERGSHLVQIPAGVGIASMVQLPDFSQLWRLDVLTTAITIALVASIETLLSVEAVDKLDPLKRISNADRELKAQGIGNFVSGLIGGLPITAVIVRSSTAVYAGGRTRMTGFVHGGILLVAVFLLPAVINRIPLSCLAAILIHVGYKLASVTVFKRAWKAGLSQFLPFMITIAAIVFTDLLSGIVIGVLASVFFVMRANHHAGVTVVNDEHHWMIRFNKDMSFVNKAELKRKLLKIPDNAELIINASKASVIDKDILEILEEFSIGALYRGIKVETIGFTTSVQSEHFSRSEKIGSV
ncbi:MAG: SulP family inorganic anion transporter [Ignavibacteria bacterium]|nr:SulP family inorganic anion transporter [Ignavibacteria bacterium]